MSEYQLPTAKLPHIPLPNIRSLPMIPRVGCAGGNSTTYMGEQFGNVPDLAVLPHINALKKNLETQIRTLIEGKLPDAVRPAVYAIHAAELVSYVSDLTNSYTSIVGQINGEISATINFANQKIGEINAAKSQILSIPESARTQVQKLTIQRYNEYAQELNAQIGRAQATLSCIGG